MKKIICILMVLVLVIGLSACGVTPEEIQKMALDDVINVCEPYGLKDISIEVSDAGKYDDYNIFYLTVTSSNFEDLPYNEMISLTEDLNAIDLPIDRGNLVMVNDFKSNGDKWEIFTSTLSIYKNDERVYSNFENSDSHQSDQELQDNNQSGSSLGTLITDNSLKIDAWVCAQNIVQNSLKSPSTAEFCSVTEATVYANGGNDYTVVGYVDAQNGFGAVVRESFIVTLTLTENGYRNGAVDFI